MNRSMKMDDLRWAVIPGTEGRYEVSTRGDVRSKPRANTKGGVLQPSAQQSGYLVVAIYASGTRESRKVRRVHRLVLEAFVGPGEGLEGRHLDGDRLNNNLSNLAWGTRSDNVRDSIRHGTYVNSMARKTHCKHGHEFTPENTRFSRPGQRPKRDCIECERLRHERQAREAAAFDRTHEVLEE